MKEKFLNHLIKDRIIKLSIIICLVLFILGLLALIISIRFLSPFVPFYNQLPWGEERIVSKYFLFLPYIFEAIFISINLSIATYIYEVMPVVSRLLVLTSLASFILVFIFTIKTIFLII